MEEGRGREVGRKDQEGREKENLEELEKGMLKVITSSTVLSSSLHTLSLYLKVATFPK